MSPIYDFVCPVCGEEEYDVLCKFDDEIHCWDCDGIMERVCNCTNFQLKYNNKTDICDWEGNSSQYWKDVKAARERGEDVKGWNE